MNATTKQFLRNLPMGVALLAVPIGLALLLMGRIPEPIVKIGQIVGLMGLALMVILDGIGAISQAWPKSKAWQRKNPKKAWLLAGAGIAALAVLSTRPLNEAITAAMAAFFLIGILFMGRGILAMLRDSKDEPDETKKPEN
jgi:uncharacterized membrane protein HdeD (DUF308 family)